MYFKGLLFSLFELLINNDKINNCKKDKCDLYHNIHGYNSYF